MLDVCWLEARGKFDVLKLSPVNFQAPWLDGTKQEHDENLREKPRGGLDRDHSRRSEHIRVLGGRDGGVHV
ncbi:hypothetical protein ACJRO7_020560 [Eucalyptus globulus]|uniref:Uncharacterized protein n=1 Tax=Eucalyptus globulus TaxID=34317 RepID=A0ABD3KJU0_EUCGL